MMMEENENKKAKKKRNGGTNQFNRNDTTKRLTIRSLAREGFWGGRSWCFVGSLDNDLCFYLVKLVENRILEISKQ